MAEATVNSGAPSGDHTSSRLLFIASCISLIATAMAFAIRGDIIGDLERHFMLDPVQKGWVNGAWAWGFAGAILFGGPICDLLGMRRIMYMAFCCHAGGSLLMIFAGSFGVLFMGTLVVGLGNGLVEAAINPLVATLYPKQKTARLNALHAWFPGGIVIGGVLCFVLSTMLGASDPEVVSEVQVAGVTMMLWQLKQGVLLIPMLVYAVMIFTQRFPATERVAAGISTRAMYKEALRPLFLTFLFCMMCTASTELIPGGWISDIMKNTLAGMANAGILVLVWINLVMCIGRFFAGPLAHAIKPTGIVLAGSAVSIVGLLLLSGANSIVAAFFAATVFGLGVCFFWPTMLGITTERFPKGGALLLAMMGASGNIGVAIANPIFGEIIKETGDQRYALKCLVVFPIFLVFVFGSIVLRDKARGGYRAEELSAGSGR